MAGCGSCTHSSNPTQINVPDTSDYTIGDPSRIFQGRWKDATFPSIPCSSPHFIYWEYRKDGGSWGLVNKFSVPNEAYLDSGESNAQLADADVWYTRHVNFADAGTYDLRIRQECGATWISVVKTIEVLAPSTRRIFTIT